MNKNSLFRPLLAGFAVAFPLLLPLAAQSPTDVPGLLLWLDASDAATIESEDGAITAWKDKGPHGYDAFQDNPDRRPVREEAALNGKPAVRFDASGPGDFVSDGLDVDPELFLERPHTVFIVDQYWGGVTGRTLQGVNQNWLIGKWNGNHGHFAGGWVGREGGILAAPEEPTYTSGVSTLFTSRWVVNGFSYGDSAVTGFPGNLLIGVNDLPPAPPFDEPSQADVSEILIYDRALGQNERVAVEAYLAEKYGLPRNGAQFATRVDVFSGADAGEGLDLSGTFVHALDAGGAGGFSIGDATFVAAGEAIAYEHHLPAFFGSSFAVDTPDDTNLNTLMQSILWTAVDGVGRDDLTITLPGLVPGKVYKLQLLIGDPGAARRWNVEVDGDMIHPNFAAASYTKGHTDLGVVLSHRFVALDATSVVRFSSAGLNGGDLNPIIQAVTLEDEGVATAFAEAIPVTSAADLDFEGTFIHAVNVLGPDAGPAGDAIFLSEENSPGVVIRGDQSVDDPGWARPEFGDTAADDTLELVMRTIRWISTNSPEKGLSVEIGGLTAGAHYKAQLLFDEASSRNRSFDISFNGVRIKNNFSTRLAYSFNEADENIARAVIVQFTAPAATVHLTLEGMGSPRPDKNPFLAGLTVETLAAAPDTDGDGLPDSWEMAYFGNLGQTAGVDGPDGDGVTNINEFNNDTDPTAADTDNDGVNDAAELALGTDPNDPDTDHDGLTDGAEVNTHHTDPLVVDTDFDFLTDGDEINTHHTDPTKLDSDHDGYSDSAEIAEGTNPLDASSWPQNRTVITNFNGGDPGDGVDLDGVFTYAVTIGGPLQVGQIRDAFFDNDLATDGVEIVADQEAIDWAANLNLGSSELDQSLNAALRTIRWGNGTPVILTMQNLEVGQAYKLQLMFYEACCTGRAFGVFLNGEEFALEFSTFNSQGQPHTRTGSMIVHHFVAAADTFEVMLDGSTVTNPGFVDHNPILNAFTLEALSATPPVVGVFAINSFTKGGNTFALEFSSTTGRNYAIDYKETLDAATWTELTDSVAGAAGASTTWTATDATLGGRATGFFRVRDTALQPTP